jgi:asparagine synthase (glutamine-hydrolysing)
MCGLTGHWSSSRPLVGAVAERIGMRMAEAIHHRGPDDSGVWVGAEGICLAHRRLSIIDLSASGHQPMRSHDGRYVIVFNGEIYNFAQLREELERECGPIAWRGHSDTEVLLAAIACWGVAVTLPKLNGMFAFALWDALEKALYLARDRFGEKPLYYGYAGETFVFGSELKALYAHPDWAGEPDADAVADFLRLCYVPAPRSIFRNVRKLMPGCWTRLGVADVAAKDWPPPRAYWSACLAALEGMSNPAEAPEAELIDETERQLRSAIGLRMVADVPLGAFLSGGIDSSLVVAMMQAQSSHPVKTFSIGFHDHRYDEAGHAANVARHLGTEHTGLYVSERDAMDVLPDLPSLYDEPFADSSQIPTFLVARMTGMHVKVALSGDGGDELFGGYNRHTWVPRVWNLASRLPQSFRLKTGAFLLKRTPAELDAGFAKLQCILPARFGVRTPGDKLHKLAGILGATRANDIYADLVSATKLPGSFMVNPASGTPNEVMFPPQSEMSLTQWMMLSDTQNYLPDDILTKVDRASMGVGLEARVPFLDPDLYAWAWRLPTSMKIRDGKGKWVLRQVLCRYVPQSMIERPKTGFGIPMDTLLRGPLREWAGDILASSKLAQHGLVNPAAVRQLFERHQSGESNNAYILWNLLVLTNWVDAHRGRMSIGHEQLIDGSILETRTA